MEVAQENQRTQRQNQEAQLRAQMAMMAGQFSMQQQLQEAQLSTQRELKRAELANTKSIADTTARANVLNGVGITDPEALSGVGRFLESGLVTPELQQIRGTTAIKQRQTAIMEQELFNNIERAKNDAKRVAIQDRAQALDERIRPILAEAAKLTSQRSGGQYGLINQAAQALSKAANELGLPQAQRSKEYWEKRVFEMFGRGK